MRRKRKSKIHSLKVEFSSEPVTSFGGFALAERLARRLGLWAALAKRLPSRRGEYSWLAVVKACVAGLLTGGRGTFAAEELREDSSLLSLLGLESAPEEATVWRCLEGLGALLDSGELGEAQCQWVRRILAALARPELLECGGWLPVFADGSLLEGSPKREGTKKIGDKGKGLMWTTIFTGPLIAAQAIAKPGQGEQTLVRELLPQVIERVLKPLKLKSRALFLADSLHGNGPSLDVVESEKLKYVVGAGALSEVDRVLNDLPESQWHEVPARPKRGWRESAVCLAWAQCADWPEKRLVVGRRVVRDNDMFPARFAVLTNLTEADLGVVGARDFAQAVWRLYDAKGRMELRYQDALSDLGLHHPPCQEHTRNAGFYALGTLAHTLGVAVELIGGRGRTDKRRQPKDSDALQVPKKIRVKPRRSFMRLWRVMRRLFALPGRLRRHAKAQTATLLGLSSQAQEIYPHYWANVCRC